MRIKSRLQQRLALLLFLLALSVSSAVWMRWSDNPGAVSEKNIREREGDGNGDDDPRRWQAMFNRGRRTRDGRPAAGYRLAGQGLCPAPALH